MTEDSLAYGTGPGHTAPAWRALAITVAATAVAMLVDRTVYEFINAPTVYDKDLGRLLRVMGFAGTWVALALAVGFHGSQDARRRGWLIFWSPMLAGALAELMKIVVRRERPALNDGAYGFRDWSERTLSGAGLAFPSSHAAVAFGGAFMLGRIFPRARWVGYVLAAGCGITRVLARAHFVSDVVFAAGLGWFVSWLLWRKWQPRAAAVVVVAMLALPSQAEAQRNELGESANLRCIEYERCALTLRPKFSGLVVARGSEETPLATLGFFWPGKRLDPVFAGDTAAVRFGREALDQRRIGALLTVGSLLTFVAAAVLVADDDAAGSSSEGIFIAAGVQAAGAVYYQFKADASLSRAVWHYNRRFAR